MILYRVECSGGVGPWRGGIIHLHRDIARAEITRDSTLYAEARSIPFMLNQWGTCWGDLITADHVFGTRTLDDLRLWYPSPAGCAAMAEAGAKLVVYSTAAAFTVPGNWEVAFDRTYACALEERPLSDLHGELAAQEHAPLPA